MNGYNLGQPSANYQCLAEIFYVTIRGSNVNKLSTCQVLITSQIEDSCLELQDRFSSYHINFKSQCIRRQLEIISDIMDAINLTPKGRNQFLRLFLILGQVP
jgi:hypothetical protein